MAITKRGARNIVVDGQPYRWYVRRRPTYSQGLCDSPMRLAVEHAEKKGAVLVVALPQFHPNNWMHGAAGSVAPADVALYVRSALANGWIPTLKGKPFLAQAAILSSEGETR